MRATVVLGRLQDDDALALLAQLARLVPEAAAGLRAHERGEAVGGRAAGDLRHRGHRVQADDEVEVGAAQQVEVRRRADPAVDVAPPRDLHRVVEAGDGAGGRDGVRRARRRARRRGRRRPACRCRSRPRPPSSSGGRATRRGRSARRARGSARRDEAARQPAGQHRGGRVALRVQDVVEAASRHEPGPIGGSARCRRSSDPVDAGRRQALRALLGLGEAVERPPGRVGGHERRLDAAREDRAHDRAGRRADDVLGRDARQPVSDSSASRAPISHEAPTTPPAPRTRPTFIGRPYPGAGATNDPGGP